VYLRYSSGFWVAGTSEFDRGWFVILEGRQVFDGRQI
jgi:hypothetical protein